MREAACLLIIILFVGCSKSGGARTAAVPAETQEDQDKIRVEYGFDGDEFVIHNIMEFPLTDLWVTLDIWSAGNSYSTLIGKIEVLEPDEWFYPEWEELKDGRVTAGVSFPLKEGLKIKHFQLDCDEGDIWEESKVQHGE
jgi:hypothetical protein